MPKIPKLILYPAYTCFGLLITAAVILLLLLNSAFFRQQLERSLSASSGREINIDGGVEFSFVHGLQVDLKDVHMHSEGMDIASAGLLSFGIDALPLLRGTIMVNAVSVQGPVVTIERYQDGSYNFKRSVSHATLKLERLNISNASIHFTDALADAEYSALNCSLDVLGRTPVTSTALTMLPGLDIAASLECAELGNKNFTVNNLQLALVGNNKVFAFKPLTMTAFGAQGTGSLLADLSGAEPRFELDLTLPHLSGGDFFTLLAPRPTVTGTLDFSTHLTMQGQTLPALKQTLTGQILLQGKNLTIEGTDLDEQLAKYESSQSFDLVDAGAFLFAGPMGLVATKGFDFANLLLVSGTRSEIPALISQWSITDGVAKAEDVAMTTRKNLLAVQGEVNFPDGQFKNLAIALLDKSGCVRVIQTIEGPFQNPQIDKPGILDSLVGPVLTLLQKFRSDEDCTVFYEGTLVDQQ